ncbi:MAG: tetratricopeptide repeat protein, partial [Verrucomicrobiia bacterium]
ELILQLNYLLNAVVTIEMCRTANNLAMPVYIYDISKKLGIEIREVLYLAKDLGIVEAKVPSSSLDDITAARLEEECLKKYRSYHERCVTKAQAAKSFYKAAEEGDADAQFNLSVCYHTGDGVPQSDSEAMKWLCKAAEQGHANAFKQLVNKMGSDERWRKAVPGLAKMLGLKSK